MTRTEHLLSRLAEECCETAQRAHKALVFSLPEIQPGQTNSNAERIIYEFNDIVALMEMLEAEGHLDRVIDRDYIELKKKKVEKMILYSATCGTLNS